MRVSNARSKVDVIEVYKILNDFDKINQELLYEMNNVTVTRDNGLRLHYLL